MTISSTADQVGEISSAVSLLFREGTRPNVAAVRSLADAGREFSVSFEPDGDADAPGAGQGWIELLASGLTFDLAGLQPASSCPVPPRLQSLGIEGRADTPLEVITLRLGPHLSGGKEMLPVLQALARLGAALSELDGAVGVCWHPASSWSAPKIYCGGVADWVAGGVFPGLILTSLVGSPDGGLQTVGMSTFTGQELRIEPDVAADRTQAAKLAVRLIDYLVIQGRITKADRILGPDSKPLRLEPSANGLFVRIWHG
ncbi:hypothetical protein [Tsuneonella sp. HG222]